MPVIFVTKTPPPDALGSAALGLAGALEAFVSHKKDERAWKLKQDEALRAAEESKQMRQFRDLQMAQMREDQEFQAREEKRKEEEDAIKIETERAALGESRKIGADVANVGAMVDEATKTSFVTPPPIQTQPVAPLASMIQPAKPTVPTSPNRSLADINKQLGVDARPQAPLAPMIQAPQLTGGQTAAEQLATEQQATDMAARAPVGEMSAADRAAGRQAVTDKAFRREVGELERREAVADKRLREREREHDERQKALFDHQDKLAEARIRASERRASVAAAEAHKKNADKVSKGLRAEYIKESAKPRERVRAIERGLSMGSPSNPTATSDYSLVYAFAKASDPESAVREGEFQGIKTNIGGWPQQAQQYWRDIVDGKMTSQKRAEMIDVIQRGLEYEKKTMGDIESYYRQRADIEDVDADRIFGGGGETYGGASTKTDPNDPEGILGKKGNGVAAGYTKPPRK